MKSLIMQGPSVIGLIDGTKTRTSRIIKPQPVIWANAENPDYRLYEWKGGRYALERYPGNTMMLDRCPYKPGETRYIKESYRFVDAGTHGAIRFESDGTLLYMPPGLVDGYDPHAWWDCGFRKHGERLQSPLFLPEFASRVQVEILGVEVLRIAETSEADIYREGVVMVNPGAYDLQTFDVARRLTIETFARLWDSIHGKHPGCSWADSPWVWGIALRRVEAGK